MKKKFAAVEKQIGDLQAKLAKNTDRQIETEQRVGDTGEAIKEVAKELTSALVNGDKVKEAKLTSELEKLKSKSIVRDEMLLTGLRKEQEELAAELQERQVRRHQLFVELCQKWLEGAVSRYDTAAEQLIARARELRVVHDQLRDLNEAEAFVHVTGAGYEAIPNVSKIPVLRDYQKASDSVAHARLHPGRELIERVMEEVLR